MLISHSNQWWNCEKKKKNELTYIRRLVINRSIIITLLIFLLFSSFLIPQPVNKNTVVILLIQSRMDSLNIYRVYYYDLSNFRSNEHYILFYNNESIIIIIVHNKMIFTLKLKCLRILILMLD